MAIFPRPVHPRVLITDVKRLWRGSTNRYKLVFGAVAIGMTSLIVTGFILEAPAATSKGPQVIYATDWPATRTDDEIRKQQWADAAEKRKADEARRREWKKIDDALTRHGL